MDKALARRLEKGLILSFFVLALTACSGKEPVGAGGMDSGSPVPGATYTIAWNAPSDTTNVTGYRIYYGTAPIGTNTGTTVDVPSVGTTSFTFQPSAHGIAAGTLLYVAVSSTGSNGLESPLSSQVSMMVQ